MDRAPRLSLALLGTFDIRLDGQPVTTFESVKVRALLAYLAVEGGRRHARTALAELLWPDLPAATARTYLRHVLAKLKEAIPDAGRDATPGAARDQPHAQPFLHITRETVAFNSDSPAWLDVTAFTGLLEACARHPHRHPARCAACAQRREAASALYRSDFLTNLMLGDSAAFEEWAALKREWLRQQMLTALADLAHYQEHCGAYAQAERSAWRQLELDPWREEAYQQLMRALWRGGHRSAALEQYRRCQRILQAELGVTPAAETTHLYEHIRDSAAGTLPPPSMADPPHNLPAEVTSLVGRVAEQAAVADLLQDTTRRLITLHGPGGIGKTRLAVHLAAMLRADFADGVWFVALAAISDLALVVPAIAAVLGVQAAPGQPVLASLTRHLSSKQLLLVLDNFEHVSAAAPAVAGLLAAAPALTVLVTSRTTLHLSGEHTFEVPPLTLPDTQHPLALAAVLQFDAVQLFLARAQAVAADFAITAGSAADVAAICSRLDGLPLAIELAAARVQLLSPAGMLQRLETPLTFLTGGPHDRPARQHTLRATIDWSYALLTAAEQQLLARLTVFVGGWTLAAAETMCGVGARLRLDPLEGLDALVAKSLVQRQPGARPGRDGALRFDMLETIRDYGLEHLAASGDGDAVRHCHLRFYRDLAEAAAPHLHSPDQGRWLTLLDTEHPNLHAALTWAQESSAAEDGLRLATAVNWYWHLRGHDREGYGWLQHFLTERPPTDLRTCARALPAATFIAWLLGEAPQANRWADAGVRLSRDLGDQPSLVHALVMLGWIEQEAGRKVRLLDEALRAARALGDPWWIGIALWFTSEIYVETDAARARTLMEASLPLFRRVGDAWSLGWLMAELGEVVYRQGQDDYARELFDHSLAQFTGIGQSTGIAAVLHNLAALAFGEGAFTRATALLDESLARFREAGALKMMARVLGTRARIALAQGDPAGATVLLDESRALYEAVGDRAGIARSLQLLGRSALQRGAVVHARSLLLESLCRTPSDAVDDLLAVLEAVASIATVAADRGAENLPGIHGAVRLLGAAAATRAHLGRPHPPGERPGYERTIAALQTQLDEATWTATWSAGWALSLAQAIAHARTFMKAS